MLLSPAEINYVEIVSAVPSVFSDHPVSSTSLDAYSQSPWFGSSEYPDPLAENFLSNESIMEVMSLEEMSVSPHIGFANGACCSTWNLSSTTWVIYDPHGELIDLQGICLGQTTNNIAEYNTIIELLSEAIALDIRELVVNLDSQLLVLQLNEKYSVRNPQILRMHLRIRLLERNFDYITSHHIPRHMSTLTDALANYMLDRHLRNM
eukprot:PITA_22194